MNHTKATKTRSVLFLWAASYVLPLLVLLLISIVVFVFSYRMIERKESSIKEYELRNFQQQMDAYIDGLTARSNEIQRNTTIAASLLALDRGDVDKAYQRYRINRELHQFTRNGGDPPIYLFFARDSYLLSGDNGGGSEFVYNTSIEHGNIPYQEFMDAVEACTSTSLVYLGGEGDAYRDYILYVRAFNYMAYRYDDTVKMVCLIQTDSLLKSIAYPYQYGNSLYVASGSDIAHVSSSEPASIPYAAMARYLDDGATGPLEGHVISQQRSERYPLRYIMATPSAMYAHDIRIVRNLIVVGVVMILLLGFVLTALALRRNYRPVKELLQLATDDADRRQGDEYSRIRSVFIQTIEDNRDKTQALRAQTVPLRNLYLARLLKGSERDEVAIRTRLRAYGVTFPHPRFVVFVLYVDRDAPSPAPDPQALIQRAGALLHDDDVAYLFEVDGHVTGIVNVPDASPWTSPDGAWLSPSLGEIQEHVHAEIVYGQSGPCDSVERLGAAYDEAMQVVDYDLLADGRVRLFSELHGDAASTHSYPIEREAYLINCIKTARFDAFRETLHELVEANLSDPSLSIHALQCLRMELINTAIKMNEEVHRLYQQAFPPEGIAEDLMACRSLRRVEQRMLSYAEDLSAFVSQETRQPATQSLKDRIIAYIQEHYSDPDLSNSTIAQHINNNANYISTVFKTQHGSGINDYINATRIEAAKRLLRETGQTIDSIAAQVGYGNARTFIRVFKKREAMTPTQYRELA